MTVTKINQPVRLPDGTFSTIAELDSSGRIEWRQVRTWKGATAYRAVLRDTLNPAEPHRYDAWDVGKLAYASRTGASIADALGA